MNPGSKIEIIHKSALQRYPRRTVGVLLEANDREVIFSLRPQFGTSTIPRDEIISLKSVPDSTPIAVNERHDQ